MRIRVLIAGAFLALLALAAPAAAQEEGEHELEHEAEECIHILEDGGDVDECQEAPNVILPETNELIWGAISFAVVAFLLGKLAWPAMKKGMEARSERIRDDLAAADNAKSEAQQVLDDYQRQLGDARNEAARIIEEARQQADAMRRDLQQRAEADIAELRQRAAADVEAAKAQAMSDLRADVASLAIGAAEQVVQQSLDSETQRQLVERYIDQVGSRQ
jgi:F-type H+-transporting ATPase subunit b